MTTVKWTKRSHISYNIIRREEKTGVWNVSMPFKNHGQPELGNSKKAALATLFPLENRFEKNKELNKLYSEAIHDAIDRGHMILVENPPLDEHYIPHHA